MDSIVFHLAKKNGGCFSEDIVLRYDFHPDCALYVGDVWTRESVCGEMSQYRIVDVRRFISVRGEELHAYAVLRLHRAHSG